MKSISKQSLSSLDVASALTDWALFFFLLLRVSEMHGFIPWCYTKLLSLFSLHDEKGDWFSGQAELQLTTGICHSFGFFFFMSGWVLRSCARTWCWGWETWFAVVHKSLVSAPGWSCHSQKRAQTYISKLTSNLGAHPGLSQERSKSEDKVSPGTGGGGPSAIPPSSTSGYKEPRLWPCMSWGILPLSVLNAVNDLLALDMETQTFYFDEAAYTLFYFLITQGSMVFQKHCAPTFLWLCPSVVTTVKYFVGTISSVLLQQLNPDLSLMAWSNRCKLPQKLNLLQHCRYLHRLIVGTGIYTH